MTILHFELKQSLDNRFLFNLVAASGEIILTSNRYTTKARARTAIQSARVNALVDVRYDRRLGVDGSPFFVLLDVNHGILGTSAAFASSQTRENVIETVKIATSDAGVLEVA